MDGRFAPSPSADLHVGNLRTALLSWLAARSRGAAWYLRIDDLDAGRSRPEIAARQLRDLQRLGLDHDGEVIAQSARTARYAAAFEQLQRAGAVYPCFCTRAEIREASSAPHGRPAGGYPGTCRNLTEAERAARGATGRAPAWRLRADPEPIAFVDRVLGPQVLPAEDAVLRRADGAFGYQLAVVLDDADQGVAEVVRGADLLESVPTQLQVQARLGLPSTAYAHVPLMIGPDGARLAKRHGAATLDEVLGGRADLELPGLTCGEPASAAQVVGALAASANLAEPGALPTLTELTDAFAYERLPVGSTMMHRCS